MKNTKQWLGQVAVLSTALLAFATASARARPLPAEDNAAPRCTDYDPKNPKPNSSVCGFLVANYQEIRERCSLLPQGHSFFHPRRRSSQPWDSIPTEVLSRLDSEAFASTDAWAGEDRQSLARLLAFMSNTPIPDPPGDPQPSHTLTTKELRHLLASSESPDELLSLRSQPLLDPDETSIVHTSSCSDVLAALVSAGASFASDSVKGNYSGQLKNDVSYTLKYGLFYSPLKYMRSSPSLQKAYYLQMLDWYLASRNPKTRPSFIEAMRAIIMYSNLQDQSTTAAGANATAGLSMPFLSFSASGSAQRNLQADITSQEFHALVSDVAIQQADGLSEVVNYLNSTIAKAQDSPKYDPSAKRVRASVAIEQMPFDLCQSGVWSLDQATNLELDSVGPVTDSSAESGAGTNPGFVSCKFAVSAQAAGSIEGYIVPAHPVNDPDDPKFKPLKIRFSVRFDTPTLNSVLQKRAVEGVWWYQLRSDAQVDKSHAPDVSSIAVSCTAPPNATVLGSFSSIDDDTQVGDFLKLTLPAGILPGASCQVKGTVRLFQQDGTPVDLPIS